MDKSKPHYRLEDVKERVAALGKQAFTKTALFNSLAMGLTGSEAVGVVLTMTRSMFYKSMTTHADPSLWQDIYHAPARTERRPILRSRFAPAQWSFNSRSCKP